jgi:DNA-binding NarL/FixJ family response regulator
LINRGDSLNARRNDRGTIMAKHGRAITFLIADEHGEIREAVCKYLSSLPGVRVVGKALNGFETISKVESLRPDVVLMDVSLQRPGSLETTRIIKHNFALTKVYLTVMFDDASYRNEAFRVSADGMISKTDLKKGLLALMRSSQTQAND